MTIRRLSLVDGSRELVLHDMAAPRLDIIFTTLDVPFPAVRTVSEDRTDTDGADDHTSGHGARSVSVGLRVFDTPAQLVDEINGYLHPRMRPWLVVDESEWTAPRRLRLRVDQFSSPIPNYGFVLRDVQLQWQAPDGVWEAASATEFVVAADTGLVGGRVYDFEPPRSYPTTAPSGRVEHLNVGNTWQHQTVKLYGPCVGPRYTNDITGETLAFTSDLVIPAGEYLEVDTQNRTAFYLSDPDASRLNYIDFENSTWWRLSPGLNRVRYHPISGVEIGSAAVVTYHPAWL